jgi:ferredoxin
MRVVVNFDLCQSHALCVDAAPEVSGQSSTSSRIRL